MERVTVERKKCALFTQVTHCAHNQAWSGERVVDTHLTLHTNVSKTIRIPLVAFHGLVQTFVPDMPMAARAPEAGGQAANPTDRPADTLLDFGTLGESQNHTI